jgi:hypothetical protein
MKGVGTLPAAVLPALLAKAPMTPEKIAFVWGLAVGPPMARATRVELSGRTLRVRTDGASWRREVERSAPLILARVRDLLGSQAVGAIVVDED